MQKHFKRKIGIFKGIIESRYEISGEIIIPYHEDYKPIVGSFVFVKLNDNSSILARIIKFFPAGLLSTGQGDEYLAAISKDNQEVPEDLKVSKLRYNLKIKLLGTIEDKDNNLHYFSSIRRIPDLGSEVFEPKTDLVEYICKNLSSTSNENETPVEIGHFSLGDIQYDGEIDPLENQTKEMVKVYFPINNLIAKRSYVFAKAGYGKSNLVKLLISKLYENDTSSGMIIFDRDGEYSFTDKNGRHGLLDVAHLKSKTVVFTDKPVDEKYKDYVVNYTRLNIGKIKSSTVVDICFPKDRQETDYSNYIRGCKAEDWRKLVDLISEKGYSLETEKVGELLLGRPIEKANPIIKASMDAAKNKLSFAISSLHRSDSELLERVRRHIQKKHIVIIDLSTMSSAIAEMTTSLILNDIFVHNQSNFTSGEKELLSTIAVIEEAQSFLSKDRMDNESPVVQWVKEGRKYNLGALLVTQQPSSIATEILSQGDNFFTFHLVSEEDLKTLQKQNAHFSDDVLTNLLNESIKGNVYFWSAPDQPFVLSARVQDFERYVNELPEKDAKVKSAVKEVEKNKAEEDELLKEYILKYMPVKTIENEQERNGLINIWRVNCLIGKNIIASGRGDEFKSTSFYKKWKEEDCIEGEVFIKFLKKHGIIDGIDKEHKTIINLDRFKELKES